MRIITVASRLPSKGQGDVGADPLRFFHNSFNVIKISQNALVYPYISACTHDIKEIPTAIAMCFRNQERNGTIVEDMRWRRKWKI